MRKRWSVVTMVAALLALTVMPTATAAVGGSERPFKATFVGEVTFDFPGESPSGCSIITTKTAGVGNATHMGRVEGSWSHCPPEVDYVRDGRLILTAANGDQLYGHYDYYEVDGVAMLTPTALVGGTGRFADATGEITAEFGVEPQFNDICNDPTNHEVSTSPCRGHGGQRTRVTSTCSGTAASARCALRGGCL